MTSPFRLATFWTLSADDAAVGGSAAPAPADAAEDGHALDFEALADDAYDRVERGDERPGREGEDEEPEADAAESPVSEGAERGLPDVPDAIVERYPAIGELRTLDESLSDPARAAETLRRFAQGVADHHGQDLAAMLGLAPAAAPFEAGEALAAERPWWETGFDSPESHALAPDYERAGFASESEYRLAQRLDALQAQLAPAIQAQQRAAAQAHYEGLVRNATPHAVAAVRAETGWTPTPDQVMAAARAHPQLATQSLPLAVQTAFLKEIVAAARDRRPRLDDMPLGAPRRGTRGYEPPADGSLNWNALADSAYETATN